MIAASEKKLGRDGSLKANELVAPMLDRKTQTEYLDHIVSLKANELVARMLDRKTRTEKSGLHWFLEGERIGSLMFDRKTRTAKAYDSKTHLDRVKHSCLRRRKDLINSNRPWSSSIGCRKSGSRITTSIDLITVSQFNKVIWFSHLSTGYLARFSKPECCIGSAAQDLITRSCICDHSSPKRASIASTHTY